MGFHHENDVQIETNHPVIRDVQAGKSNFERG